MISIFENNIFGLIIIVPVTTYEYDTTVNPNFVYRHVEEFLYFKL